MHETNDQRIWEYEKRLDENFESIRKVRQFRINTKVLRYTEVSVMTVMLIMFILNIALTLTGIGFTGKIITLDVLYIILMLVITGRAVSAWKKSEEPYLKTRDAYYGETSEPDKKADTDRNNSVQE